MLPIGAALHVLKAHEAKTLDEVSTDDCNRHIAGQMSQIKAICKLP
jgi:hypothetical protein